MNKILSLLILGILTLASAQNAFADNGRKPAILDLAQEVETKIKLHSPNDNCQDCTTDIATGTLPFWADSKTKKNGTVSILSEQQLNELFKEIASHKEFRFDCPAEGCFIRAHNMAQLMDQKGIISAKVFIEADDEADGYLLVKVDPKIVRDGFVEWRYHVASCVLLEKNGKKTPMVLDPSLFNKPVTAEEWRARITEDLVQRKQRVPEVYFTHRFVCSPEGKEKKLTDYEEILSYPMNYEEKKKTFFTPRQKWQKL